MVDYEKMYYRQFNAITNAINILQAAQTETEEIYINSEPVKIDYLKIVPFKPNIEKEEDTGS